MKTIGIGNKDYTFEYTIEAALYKECAESVISFFSEEALAENKNDVKSALSNMAGVPTVTMQMFYAGLIENHSDEIKSISDAKNLLKIYFAENPEKANFYDLFIELSEIMGDDGFFKNIGLEKMISQSKEQETKKPTDHKKKAKKVSEN